MSVKPPIPDPTLAVALAQAGYWCVPLTGHRKHPGKIGDKTHGELVRSGDRDYLTAHVLATQHTATGWALIPQPGDPEPLAILDLDLYGLGLGEAWAKVADALPLDPLAPVVRSASGGWHFWFRLPNQTVADRLPHTWDFGDGRKGEVRASRAVIQLIVLPGSVCLGKSGELGQYTLAQGNIVPTGDQPLLPDSLQIRLTSRSARAADPEKSEAPTEAQHYLRHLRFISEIPEGVQNSVASQIGQVLGRIGPGERPSSELVSNAWAVFSERAPSNPTDPWTFTRFDKALRSGYKTGQRNAREFAPRDKVPTVDDAKSEVIAIFGGWPALTEMVDFSGKVVEYVLSFEGRMVKCPSLETVDVAATLTLLFPGVDRNAVSQSPVFVLPGWARVILYALKAERTTERMGNDPETTFWEILEAAAEDAADGGKFLTIWNGSTAALGSPSAFLVCPAADEWWLALTSQYENRLFARVGSATETKRLIKQNLVTKTLSGGKGGRKILVIAVERLSESTRNRVRKGFEGFLAARGDEEQNDGSQ